MPVFGRDSRLYKRDSRLTPFALLGVTLPPGTYIFERADPVKMDLVRILSRDRSQVYLMAFAQLAEQPKSAAPIARFLLGKGSCFADHRLELPYDLNL